MADRPRPAVTRHHRDWRQEDARHKACRVSRVRLRALVWLVSDRLRRGPESQLIGAVGTVPNATESVLNARVECLKLRDEPASA